MPFVTGDVKEVYASLNFPVGRLMYDLPSAANSLREVCVSVLVAVKFDVGKLDVIIRYLFRCDEH